MKHFPLPFSVLFSLSAVIVPAPFFSNSPVLAQTAGCGSGWSNIIINYAAPALPIGSADITIAGRQFRVACDEHDVCYDTPRNSKQDCDRAFHNRMLDICARDHNTIVGRPLRIACNGRADAFHTAASDFGQTAYDNAQRAARPTVRTEILPTTVTVIEPPQPTREPPPSTCLNVDSRQGWQSVTVNHGVSSTQIGGGWSVDTRSYSMVSYGGHEGSDAERLAPFNAYKYDQRFPFGALLMDVPEHGVVWVDNPSGWIVRRVGFPAGATFRLRINDADNALGDNGGALRVCLVPGIG